MMKPSVFKTNTRSKYRYMRIPYSYAEMTKCNETVKVKPNSTSKLSRVPKQIMPNDNYRSNSGHEIMSISPMPKNGLQTFSASQYQKKKTDEISPNFLSFFFRFCFFFFFLVLFRWRDRNSGICAFEISF